MSQTVTPARRIEAYQHMAETEDGQIVIQDLLRLFGYTRNTTFTDTLEGMAFREGQRSVVVHIGRMLDADAAAQEALDKGEME
jgi:hypothetical protein